MHRRQAASNQVPSRPSIASQSTCPTTSRPSARSNLAQPFMKVKRQSADSVNTLSPALSKAASTARFRSRAAPANRRAVTSSGTSIVRIAVSWPARKTRADQDTSTASPARVNTRNSMCPHARRSRKSAQLPWKAAAESIVIKSVTGRPTTSSSVKPKNSSQRSFTATRRPSPSSVCIGRGACRDSTRQRASLSRRATLAACSCPGDGRARALGISGQSATAAATATVAVATSATAFVPWAGTHSVT